MALTISSTAFQYGQPIPQRYTCEGENISPSLRWQAIPEGTQSLALIIDDPDAPDPKAPKMTWVHWILYNIPTSAQGLTEDAAKLGLPDGACTGLNDWKHIGYGGPCPPIGQHRYFHKLYALDTQLLGLSTPTKSQLELAMQGHILAETNLIGTYEKR